MVQKPVNLFYPLDEKLWVLWREKKSVHIFCVSVKMTEDSSMTERIE